MSSVIQSRFTVHVPLEYDRSRNLALYNTLTGAFIIIQENEWASIIGGSNCVQSKDISSMLLKEGILVTPDTDETLLFESWRQQHVHNFSTVKSKVLVTRRCNNRCRFCILEPEPKDMSRETAQKMDRFYTDMILEKKPFQVIDDFLGGEPFLNAGIIMGSAQRRFFFCKGIGIDYSFTITTNGTLITKPTISDMKEVGLTGIRVSLAGPASIHDHLRPSITFEKTYEKITNNLEIVSGLIPISIECQFDSGALDFLSIPEMLDNLVHRNIRIDSIAFTPILSRRGANPFDSGMGDPRIFLYLKHEALKRGYPMNDQAHSNACMADFCSTIVFDTDGSIIPCPSLQGSEMSYGHVTTGIDFVAESRLLKRNLPDKCLNECELLPICFGGCRLQALIHQRNFNGIDCHYNAYRLFLEDYIREKALTALSR
jgi:uncharacterized protein